MADTTAHVAPPLPALVRSESHLQAPPCGGDIPPLTLPPAVAFVGAATAPEPMASARFLVSRMGSSLRISHDGIGTATPKGIVLSGPCSLQQTIVGIDIVAVPVNSLNYGCGIDMEFIVCGPLSLLPNATAAVRATQTVRNDAWFACEATVPFPSDLAGVSLSGHFANGGSISDSSDWPAGGMTLSVPHPGYAAPEMEAAGPSYASMGYYRHKKDLTTHASLACFAVYRRVDGNLYYAASLW
jgi:hypothetical protein